jgi:hypothetical protein
VTTTYPNDVAERAMVETNHATTRSYDATNHMTNVTHFANQLSTRPDDVEKNLTSTLHVTAQTSAPKVPGPVSSGRVGLNTVTWSSQDSGFLNFECNLCSMPANNTWYVPVPSQHVLLVSGSVNSVKADEDLVLTSASEAISIQRQGQRC